MATLTVKTTTVKEDGQAIYQARVYRSGKLVHTVNLRGGGFSSKSAFDMALNGLASFVGETKQDGDVLKVEKNLNKDLGLVCTEI